MKARIVASVVAGVAIALVAGCGSSDARTVESKQSATTTTAKRLAGRYAHYDVVAYDSSLLKNLIISYGFTDLTVKGDKLIAHESFCHADQTTDQPIMTTISDAGTRAIKPVSIAVKLSTKNGRARLQRAETPTGVGIHFADPAHDTLPKDPADPRIADDDHDGKPGITVHVNVSGSLEGDIYIARRERFAYDVTEQADRSLTGTVEDHSEQLILGATDPVFNIRSDWTQMPDLTKSPIFLKPVGKDWDCTRLMAARDTLFPPAPKVDW